MEERVPVPQREPPTPVRKPQSSATIRDLVRQEAATAMVSTKVAVPTTTELWRRRHRRRSGGWFVLKMVSLCIGRSFLRHFQSWRSWLFPPLRPCCCSFLPPFLSWPSRQSLCSRLCPGGCTCL